jgi:membrane protein implicated in regulation of membrane protease activity
MDWADSTLWWVAAGALVAVELSLGSFYLLMLALGCVAGALAAHAGAGGSTQIVVAALLGSGATASWHFKRARTPRSLPAATNRDVNLDIGEHLRVPAWDSDGSARVDYRGSAWTVRFDGPGQPQPGEHVIVAVHGNRLMVSPTAKNTL